MGFLDSLSSSLLQQSGLAENTPGNLDFKGRPFGKLGDIASKIDATAQRQYIETGAIRNIRPRASEVLMQEPDITVVIKKRIFASLSENYRTDLMDNYEKLFLRATKKLFHNKIRLISAYERLSKFDRIASKNEGIISDYALPFIFDSVDIISNSPLSGIIDNNTRAVLETIRKVKRFSDPQFFTTWNIASELPYATETGEGTGTFDLTLVSSIDTTNSVNLGGGSANITIEDPYKLMIITEQDIEQALSDSTSLFKQNNFFRFSQNQLGKTNQDLKDRLTQIRQRRGAASIFFKIQENTILFKKVRAIIDEEGREIDFSFDGGVLGVDLLTGGDSSVSIDSLAFEGDNGLQGQETNLFKQIVNNIYLLLGFAQTTQSQNREYNVKTNYIRKKMFLHYHGKPIIQPMDTVTIFASSKTMTDSKVTQGLKHNFAQNSLLNNINDTISNIESSFNNIKDTFSGGGSGTSNLEQEKNAIAGPAFPLWLYGLMRNDFTRQNSGTCVFSGICDVAPHRYEANSGKYVLSVSCNDNTSFMNMGQINVNPSVEVFNGSLYDPLTPFKSDFDEASGFDRGEFPTLLDANVRLLNSRSVRAKLGRRRGSSINESTFQLSDTENVNSGQGFESNKAFGRRSRNKFHPPDGFVYRWKEGIGSLVLYGEPHSQFDVSLGSFKAETSPNITQNQYAGQDVMNVLSLLITGQPYNYNNFVKGSVEFAKLQKNDSTNKNLSSSFFKGLITQITDQNATWGNFIPFKKLIINERAYQFLASGQVDLSVKNERLNSLLRQRAETFDELTSVASGFANSPQNYRTGAEGNVEGLADDNISALNDFVSSLKQFDEQIRQAELAFSESIDNVNLQSDEGTLGIFGDDISFDPAVTGIGNEENEEKRRQERSDLRSRLNHLTRRRIWKVRGNEDPNLFIVDDSYDKNYDVQAFEKALSTNLELFNSTYSSVFDQVKIVSKLIGLEVFADSQGHIQARPPQYNRMPSSVFRSLIQKRAQTGVQIFPSYLERLFFTSLQGLSDELEIVEDQIRLRTAALGRTTDFDSQNILTSGVSGNGSGAFQFLTERSSGKLNNDIRSLLDQDDPDLQEQRKSGPLTRFSALIRGPLNATVNFNAISRVNIVQSDKSFNGNVNNINDEIAKIAARLKQRTRQNQPSNLQAVLSNDRVISLSGRKQVDVLRVTNQISQFVSERQRIIKRLANSIKNLTSGLEVNATDSSSSQESLSYPNLFQSKSTPEILEHMIEDENIDDFGVGSGGRFIIEDFQIKSFEITEKAPPYCSVQVDGKLDGGLVPQPQGLNVGNGGNGNGTAWAIDYDLWRMYGFRGSQQVSAPFFSNPNTQCAPYAVFLLNLARKNIFQASCTVVGNEFIQAGEVYYIEDRNLLFYAESVSHSFTYNGSFETTLTLKYGRTPGEYIPTHLDIIGKALYSNKHEAELVRQVRHGRVDDSTHIGTLVFDNSVSIVNNADGLKALVSGEYAETNKQTLSNILLMTSGLLTPSKSSKELKLEVRIYKNSDTSISLISNSNLKRVAQGVRGWVIDPSSKVFGEDTLIPVSENPPSINGNKIDLTEVDLNPAIQNEIRSPSSLAWSSARSIAASSNISVETPITTQENEVGQTGGTVSEETQTDATSNALIDRERKALVNSVIDIWVTFNDPAQVLQSSKQPTETNQAAQQEQEQINK